MTPYYPALPDGTKVCKRNHVYSAGKTKCPECQKHSPCRDPKKRSAESVAYFQKHKDKKAKNNKLYLERHPDKVRQHTNRSKEAHPLRSIHSGMRNRCCNPNDPEFKNYGARGISVAVEWLGRGGFRQFEMDMSPRPTLNHSLERKDNNLGYSKENCKWATRKEQCNNTRGNRPITIDGRTRNLKEWAEEIGISPTSLGNRIKRGWPTERLLEKPHIYKLTNLGVSRRAHLALLRLHRLLEDSEYDGQHEVIEILRELGLIPVAERTPAAA